MSDLGGKGAGYQFMVSSLVDGLIPVLPRLKAQPRAGKRGVKHNVDLIKGQPVFYQAVKPLKAHLRVPGKALNHLPALPGFVLFHQPHGNIKVAQGHQRFNAVLFALFKHVRVKPDPRLIRRLLIPVGEDPGPGDAGAEALKSHLPEEPDILLVMMIKVNGVVGRIVLPLHQLHGIHVAELHIGPVLSMRDHVNRGQSLSILQVSPLCLIGGNSPAPQKIFWKHLLYLLLFSDTIIQRKVKPCLSIFLLMDHKRYCSHAFTATGKNP